MIGLLAAAVGLYGLSRLGVSSGPNDVILWFILIGAGLSPAIVGGADVIVGNAPVELAGVAGGVNSTAMQLGGVLGTSVLGAVMASRVNDLLPQRWAAADLPVLPAGQFADLKSYVSLGVAPAPAGVPHQIVLEIAEVVHSVFMSGLDRCFLVAAIATVVAALGALLLRRDHRASESVLPF
jgi:hypothetical protein